MESGETTLIKSDPKSSVKELKAFAKEFFKKRFLRLLFNDRALLDSETLNEVLHDGATVSAVVQSPLLAANRQGFAVWCSGSRVVTWGETWNNPLQDNELHVEKVVTSEQAFAAVLSDGGVVAWGHKWHGGDCSEFQDQLKNVRDVKATRGAFEEAHRRRL